MWLSRVSFGSLEIAKPECVEQFSGLLIHVLATSESPQGGPKTGNSQGYATPLVIFAAGLTGPWKEQQRFTCSCEMFLPTERLAVEAGVPGLATLCCG